MTDADERDDDLPLSELHRWLRADRWGQAERLDDLVDALSGRLPSVDASALERRLRAHRAELKFFVDISRRAAHQLLRTLAWECTQ